MEEGEKLSPNMRILQRGSTYAWHFYSEKHSRYFEYANEFLYEHGGILQDEQQKDCVSVPLYSEYYNYPNENDRIKWALDLRHKYFGEIFSGVNRDQPRFNMVILPREVYYSVLETVNDSHLLHIRDVIIEIIAMTQYVYCRMGIHDTIASMPQKEFTEIHKEIEKLIEVIEKSGVGNPYDESYSEIRRINFVFDSDTITLKSNLLRYLILQAIKEYFGLRDIDWRNKLMQYQDAYGQLYIKNELKKQLALGWLGLIAETSGKDLHEYGLPNEAMHNIALLMEHSLVPISNEEETRASLINKVRDIIRNVRKKYE